MQDIKKSKPSAEQVAEMGITDWPTWSKEASTFPWTYAREETCYLIEGDVIVTPENGDPVRIGKGDLVTFPAGMNCTWEIREPVRKHYRFG